MTFKEWLLKQEVTDNPMGDFIDDTKSKCRVDKLKPYREQFPENPKNYDTIWSYLSRIRACDEAKECALFWWIRYNTENNLDYGVRDLKEEIKEIWGT